MVATAPAAEPCIRRFSDSPCRIEGTCMVFPFVRHVSERGHGHPDGFRLIRKKGAPINNYRAMHLTQVPQFVVAGVMSEYPRTVLEFRDWFADDAACRDHLA